MFSICPVRAVVRTSVSSAEDLSLNPAHNHFVFFVFFAEFSAGIGFRFYLRRFSLNRRFQVIKNAQSQSIGRGLKNFKGLGNTE
jgi:hypothetical protein